MSAAILTEAARHMTDAVEHAPSPLGKIIGGIAGFVLGAALVVGVALLMATGVGALVVASVALTVGLAMSDVGEKVGEAIQKMFPPAPKNIVKGSPDVTVGSRSLQAARVKDEVSCHSGKKIASGCATITINREPAARVQEKTECSGEIKTGCATVKYGGPSITVLAIEPPPEEQWLLWYNRAKTVLQVADFVLGIVTFKGGARAFFNFKGRIVDGFRAVRGSWSALRGGVTMGRLGKAVLDTHGFVDPVVSTGMNFFEGKYGERLGYFTESGQPVSALGKWGFTEGAGYQGFAAGYNTVGLAGSARDLRDGLRRPTETSPIQTPEAPQGTTRTDGGVLELAPPAGHTRSSGGILLEDPPAGFHRSEGGVLMPGSAPPPDAPRLSPAILDASGNPISSTAPRLQPAILDASGTPIPADAPRLQPPILDAGGQPLPSTADLRAAREERFSNQMKGSSGVVKGAFDVYENSSNAVNGPPPPGP